MDQHAHDLKLTLIGDYLQKQLPHCVVETEPVTTHQVQLSVTHGVANRCTVHVSLALLLDPHVSPVELRWALKDRHIAAHVRWNEAITLDHKTLRIGHLAAIGRRPRNARSAAH